MANDDLAPFGPSNVVDQPALEWLARQPGPRIWISDGKVTGCNDRPSRRVKQACAEICRRSHIRRVDDAAEAAAVLGARARRAA